VRVAFLFDWKSPEGAVDGTGIGKWAKAVLDDLCKISSCEPVGFFYALPKWLSPKERATFYKSDPLNRALPLRKALGGAEAVVTFGPIATFVATGKSFERFKGTHVTEHHLGPGIKHVVPTISPDLFAYKAWKTRAEVMLSLAKVQRFPDEREQVALIPERVEDIVTYLESIKPGTVLSFDVETLWNEVNEFSLAPSGQECLYVPIFTEGGNRWTEEEEVKIWTSLHKVAMDPTITWTFHNSVYDLTYLDGHGIHPLGLVDDTMLMQHAINPEWRKSLGNAAAHHLDVPAWKHLRVKSKKAINKRGEVD